jgi:putative membrane protein
MLVALSLVFALVLALTAATANPLTRHMAFHILLMNALAPAVALALHHRIRFRNPGLAVLSLASAGQIASIWLVHAPPIMELANASVSAHVAVQVILFCVALFFWNAIFSLKGAARGYGLISLLMTGKLFCLLGALIVFAPRSLYPASIWEACLANPSADLMLQDQQLAGLLMLAACPLSYVAAGIAIAANWFAELRAESITPIWRSGPVTK